MENKKNQIVENKMGTMPVTKLILSMAWPAMLSMSINALYNIIDSMFVSRVSQDAFTAVSIVFPLQMILIAVAVGTGVGVNSLISRKLGAGLQQDADKAAQTGIVISILDYIIFFLIGAVFAVPFCKIYATQGTEIYNSAIAYLRIVMLGAIFISVEIMIEKIVQATGNMKGPMICGLIGCIVNIILDPIFIFGYFGVPALGATGAAIATVLGQISSFIFGMVMITRPNLLVNAKIKGFKFDKTIIGEIYEVGLPAIIMQMIASILNLFYNMILIAYSDTAIAVLSAYFKLQNFVFLPVFGLNQGALPVMGYNFGARNKERLTKAYKVSLIIALIIMVIGTVVFQIFPSQLLSLFDATPEMLKYGVPALRIISINFPFAAYGIMNGTIFSATGHGVYSLIVSVVRQIVVILPAAYILAKIGGVAFSWWSFPIGEVAGIIYSTIMLKRLWSKEIKNM